MALKYFQKAAEQGWVDGQLQLGTMYYSECVCVCVAAPVHGVCARATQCVMASCCCFFSSSLLSAW